MKAAFLGLGVMGQSMASHLLEKMGALVVYNRTRSKTDSLVEKGALRAETPADAARQADIICLCVADTPDVEEVVFGENGIYTALQPGSLVIDFSTISAAATEEFAEKAAEKKTGWVDAPISGGDVGARNATLSIMAGGSPDDFQRARPIFEAVGKSIHHMGPTGHGQRTKMANQIACCGTIASMAEALNFAREKGMDTGRVLEAISGGAGGSWSLSNYGPRVLNGDFDPGFSVRLMAKDLRLVAEAMENLTGDYTATQHMRQVFDRLNDEGEGDRGVQASIRKKGWE